MNIRVGHIPYLNMVPFHHGFGPQPMELDGNLFEFHTMSPRELGLQAEKGTLDAGALSLVDWLRCSSQYEPVGRYGIGLKRPAQSVLFFSNKPMPFFHGTCAVTDETSTSFKLLQVLFEVRYGLRDIRYGRISPALFDGEADGLLLIGDEALRAKKEGVSGLPHVTDLGEEWYIWQNVPFVFARWAVRHSLRQEVKEFISLSIQKALNTNENDRLEIAGEEALNRRMSRQEIIQYWNGFSYELTPAHEKSIAIFSELLEKVYVG
jgi:predicted solute-binding protein